LPSVLEDQRPGVGDVGHEGTVIGVITRLPQGTTLASCGQAGAAQDPEEVRFADVEPFALERGVDVRQGGPLAAEFAGPLVDVITFRGCLAAGPGGGEERVDVGVACEVPGWFFPFLLNKDRRVASQADRRLEEQSPSIRIQPSHERKLPPSRHLCISKILQSTDTRHCRDDDRCHRPADGEDRPLDRAA